LRELMENDVFKADMHIHTKYSGMMKYMGLKFPDSVEEPLKVMKCAKANGMNIIAVTDHNTIKGALETKKYGYLEFCFYFEVIHDDLTRFLEKAYLMDKIVSSLIIVN